MSFQYKLDTRELDALAVQFAVAAKLAPGVFDEVTEAAAAWVEAEAKRKVPVDSGDLQRSIGHEKGAIFAGEPYAGFVEFGTAHMRPQPYLRPAIDAARGPYRKALGQAGAALMGDPGGGKKLLRMGNRRGLLGGRFNRVNALARATSLNA